MITRSLKVIPGSGSVRSKTGPGKSRMGTLKWFAAVLVHMWSAFSGSTRGAAAANIRAPGSRETQTLFCAHIPGVWAKFPPFQRMWQRISVAADQCGSGSVWQRISVGDSELACRRGSVQESKLPV